jgi:hypothetical protein
VLGSVVLAVGSAVVLASVLWLVSAAGLPPQAKSMGSRRAQRESKIKVLLFI